MVPVSADIPRWWGCFENVNLILFRVSKPGLPGSAAHLLRTVPFQNFCFHSHFHQPLIASQPFQDFGTCSGACVGWDTVSAFASFLEQMPVTLTILILLLKKPFASETPIVKYRRVNVFLLSQLYCRHIIRCSAPSPTSSLPGQFPHYCCYCLGEQELRLGGCFLKFLDCSVHPELCLSLILLGEHWSQCSVTRLPSRERCIRKHTIEEEAYYRRAPFS